MLNEVWFWLFGAGLFLLNVALGWWLSLARRPAQIAPTLRKRIVRLGVLGGGLALLGLLWPMLAELLA